MGMHRGAIILAGAVGVMAAASVAARAAGEDAQAIAHVGLFAEGVPPCATCHGLQGQGVDAQGGPRLAHLDPGYLKRQLDAFAAGGRRSDVMTPIARHLTPAQRSALAAYFAGLPEPGVRPAPIEASRLARGRELAQDGDWSVKAPACDACHGPDGGGVGSLTPPLVGQSEAYLLRQIQSFRAGDRSGPLDLMAGVARRLSADDLHAAAAWYASRPFPTPSSERKVRR